MMDRIEGVFYWPNVKFDEVDQVSNPVSNLNCCGDLMRRAAKDLLVPLLILMALTILFRLTDLDLRIESLFYSAQDGWIYRNDNPWMLLYEYGAIPAIALAVGAFIALLVSYRCQALASFRRQLFFILAVLLIGPGLIVNLGLKENWGRPRPREVIYFGGHKEFQKVWERGPTNSYSFPSGHAAIGFFMLCPYFIFRNRRRNLANVFLIGGLAYGSSMGLARMIQGQHFPSDVIWSGGLIYLSAAGCYYLLGLHREGDRAGDHVTNSLAVGDPQKACNAGKCCIDSPHTDNCGEQSGSRQRTTDLRQG